MITRNNTVRNNSVQALFFVQSNLLNYMISQNPFALISQSMKPSHRWRAESTKLVVTRLHRLPTNFFTR